MSNPESGSGTGATQPASDATTAATSTAPPASGSSTAGSGGAVHPDNSKGGQD